MTDAPKPQSINALFGTNRQLEEDGKWFEYSSTLGLKLRRFSAKKALAVKAALEKPYANRMGKKIPDSDAEEITLRYVAEGIIVDWRGVFGDDGVEIPFSIENAYAVIKELPELLKQIINDAVEVDGYKDQDNKAIAKN